MFKPVFIKSEGGWYNVELATASKIIALQNRIEVLKASGEYAEAEKVQENIYNIMDKALFELDAYPIEESEVA